MKKTNALTEGAIMAAFFTIFMGITLYVPLLSLLSMWLLPLPLVIYTTRNGLRSSLLLWMLVFTLSLLLGSIYGLAMAFIFGSGGLVIGHLYRMQKSAFSILFGGSLAFTTGIILIFIFGVEFLHFNAITYAIKTGNDVFQQIQHATSSLGTRNQKSLGLVQNQLKLIRYLAPFVFILMGTVYALITQLIAAPTLKRLGLKKYVRPWIPFRDWHFPKSILWYYLIFLLIGFFQHFTKGSMWYIGYYNLISALEVVILIQGFTFIFFYFHAKEKPKVIPILLTVIAIIFAAVLSPIVELIGLLDLGFDLRKRMQSK